MKKVRKFWLVFTFIGIIVATSPIFARARTNHFSAYASCQKVALSIKGNAAWEYESAYPEIFGSQIHFSDGYNDLTCVAKGVGPFWFVLLYSHTCFSETFDMCPDVGDYMD